MRPASRIDSRIDTSLNQHVTLDPLFKHGVLVTGNHFGPPRCCDRLNNPLSYGCQLG